MEYVKIAETADFATENKLQIFVRDKEILLTKIENNYFAIDNKCTHMGGSLYKGQLVGKEIICPRHHTRFDVTTGKVSKGAKIMFMKLNAADTNSYPIRIEEDDILIGLE